MSTINTLTDAQKTAICELYSRHVKPNWLNLFTRVTTETITFQQLDASLQRAYSNTKKSEYGLHWLKLGSYRVTLDTRFADMVFEHDTIISHGDSNVNRMQLSTYSEITRTAAFDQRTLLEYIMKETFKHVPGDELFSICDDMKINLLYKYNWDNPEPRTITLIPLRSPGRANERKVHRHVLADISKRFATTIYGSGQLKPKNTITINCDIRLLDWFIDGIYKGVLDLNLIRKKQRKYAYQMLNETMVCTPQELGDKMAIHFGLIDIDENTAPQTNYFNDSDSD